MEKKYDYIVHTDGAYSRMNDEGSAAWIICDGMDNEKYRNSWKIKKQTNNRAELWAIIDAMLNLPEDAKNIRIETDSQYALNTLSRKWHRNANSDLFEFFDNITLLCDLKIDWVWVKGHSGDKYNEICDKMCQEVLGYDPSIEYRKYKKN